jgi:CheY-like chemotaxis protein
MFYEGDEPPKLLIVDDLQENLFATEKVLSNLGAEIITAASGNEALKLVLRHKFALILMDVQMPEMDGFEAATHIRSNEATKNIPIVFLTALDKTIAHKGFSLGAADYITKPVDPDVLRSKVTFYLRLWRARNSLDTIGRRRAAR